MYEKIKRLIPKKLIERNEKMLRSVISLAYKGNTYYCNICHFKMSKFIQLKKDDKLCPKCGSLARTRRLWSLLEDKISEKKILHFSPSKSIKPKLESIANIEYVTTDYVGEFKANKKLNIVAIDEPNNTYDLIICYHILEHIEHDLKAMTELLRILKPGGTCLIQTPFKTGEIYEDETIKTEAERLVHFGQEDHVRVYSVDGLIQRLESVGFKTHLLEFNEIENNSNGFEIEERSIEAVKPI